MSIFILPSFSAEQNVCLLLTYCLKRATKVHFFHQHTSMTYFYGKDVICAILGKLFFLKEMRAFKFTGFSKISIRTVREKRLLLYR